MKLLHKPIPLDAPLQDGEVVYTPLQLSRLRRSAINFQRIVLGALILFLVASGLFVAASIAGDAHRTHDQCVSSNHGRAEIKSAFATLYDGFTAASHGDPRAIAFKNQGMARLERGLPQRPC